MKQLHIVESAGKYLVVELFNYRKNYYSKIHAKPFNSIDAANQYVIMVNEDAVPAMASSGVQAGGKPQVATFDPILKLKGVAKKILRRRHPQ